jgi:KDO2-lipid IV(A) lauroyltransferase
MARIGIFILWLLHFLPLPVLALVGQGLGLVAYSLARERRRVARTNLRLCFPEMGPRERERLVRGHFQALSRSFFEHGILWWSSAGRIRRLVRIEGHEHLTAAHGLAQILLAPHFVGLDMGGLRISLDMQVASLYSKQKNPVTDQLLLRGRLRFNAPRLFSRQDSVRGVVKTIRAGLPVYYLPDMDFGRRDSIFVPFFGIPAATITGVSRLASLSRAKVLPAVTQQLPGGRGYVLKIYPAWENFPTEDVAADARRVNAFIEDRIREMPAQYLWVHKRFKTRPEGAPRVYP